MEVVLIDMFVDVGVKSETPALAVIPVLLTVLVDPVLHRGSHCRAKEMGVKGTVGLSAILDLQELLGVGPCMHRPPVLLEDGKHRSIVSKKGWGLNAIFFKGLKLVNLCRSLLFSVRMGARWVNSLSMDA